MPRPFACELGCFDPTFPGITLHFPSEEVWNKYVEVTSLYVRLGAHDLVDKNPALKLADATPQRVFEHIMASPEHGLNGTPEEKEEIGREFIARDPENAVANLAMASAFEHERRHFHDWLLSPYTASLNLIRAEVFGNFGGVRHALGSAGATVIPVPLTRWLRKTPLEQQELLTMWQSLLGDQALQLPDFTTPGLHEAVQQIGHRYGSIGGIFRPMEGTSLDVAALFEASALCIQIQAIHDLFGATASRLFGSSMAGLGTSSRYGWFLQAMGGLQKPGEALENNSLSTMATWCLLGNSEVDPEHGHPLTRFMQAFQCVQRHGHRALDRSSADILDFLDASTGCVPWRDALEHSVAQGQEVSRSIQQMAEKRSPPSNLMLAVAQSQGFLHECHAYMARLLIDDPDGYCQPVAYLDRSLERLPEPPLRHTFGRPFRVVDRSKLGRYERSSVYETHSTPERVALRQTIVQIPRGIVDLQLADNWQFLCSGADAVFAEFNRDQPEIDEQRERALRQGVRYIEVLE